MIRALSYRRDSCVAVGPGVGGAPASTTAPTSAATSATWPRRRTRIGCGTASTTTTSSRRSSRPPIALAVTPRKWTSSRTRTTPRPGASWVRSTTCWPRSSRATRRWSRRCSPAGISAAAVNGCWQCHGSVIQVDKETGILDPATWPNSGIGRVNPDGSRGSCAACHSRHDFSAALARRPENCGKCHLGPDHPQFEVYEESKHGIAFHAHEDEMALDSSKWIVGEDYTAAPTCATCHMSATKNQDISHNIGLRIKWNNRPVHSKLSHETDKKWNLSSASITADERRENMNDVCTSCHQQRFVDNFFMQYEASDRALRQQVRHARARRCTRRRRGAEDGSGLRQVQRADRLHLVRALASRRPARPPRGGDDGPGLHALARNLRSGQELDDQVHPGDQGDHRALREEPEGRERGQGAEGRFSKKSRTPTTGSGRSTRKTPRPRKSARSARRSSRESPRTVSTSSGVRSINRRR